MDASTPTIDSFFTLLPYDPRPLRAEFLQAGYLDLSASIPQALFATLQHEVATIMNHSGRRKNLSVAVTGGTPRIYRMATREALLNSSPWIAQAYRSPSLLQLVADITGEKVTHVPYPPEEFVATRYEYLGDTHGWHWDDYAFALIWILEAPPPEAGGTLEFVLNIPWNKSAPGIDAALQAGPIQRRHPGQGTVYLLRTDTTLHRVTPLLQDCRREMLCFSYAAPADFHRSISHETIEI